VYRLWYEEALRRHRFKKRRTIEVVFLSIIIGFGEVQLVKAEIRAGTMLDSQRVVLLRHLISQIQRCFVPPIESFPDPVTVEVHLERDGTLSKLAEIIGPQSRSAPEQVAIPAFSCCAPYHIPSQFTASYEQWKRLQVTFR
jgi:hypothetical protein